MVILRTAPFYDPSLYCGSCRINNEIINVVKIPKLALLNVLK